MKSLLKFVKSTTKKIFKINPKGENYIKINSIILGGQVLLIQQYFVCLLLPTHLLPPCFACLTILLVLALTPDPQVLEQEDHRPQEDH